MSDMNELIRARRSTTTITASTPGGMDEAIRTAIARGPAQQQGEGNAEASPEQLAAARFARLPDRYAHRIVGDDLNADAAELAKAVTTLGGELIPSVSFDGGARGTGERGGGTSMDDQLRRARDNRKLFGGEIPFDNFTHLHTDR